MVIFIIYIYFLHLGETATHHFTGNTGCCDAHTFHTGKFGASPVTSYNMLTLNIPAFLPASSLQDFCCWFLFFWMWVCCSLFVCLLVWLVSCLVGTLKEEVYFTLCYLELLDSSYSPSSACWVAGATVPRHQSLQLYNTEESILNIHSLDRHLLNTNRHAKNLGWWLSQYSVYLESTSSCTRNKSQAWWCS